MWDTYLKIIIKERNLNGFVEEEVIISEELEKPNEDVKKLKELDPDGSAPIFMPQISAVYISL